MNDRSVDRSASSGWVLGFWSRFDATRPSADGERLESPADAVLIRRCGIAAEWADALERVPDEHLAWNGWVLEKSLA